jgi:hypothetical protein
VAKDNSSNDKTKSRSAVASWSGYNYQGKVGIYVALCKIQELSSSDSTSLENFYVEYESLEGEDFDIKENEKILSRHQVKAIQKKYLSNYKEVLNGFDIEDVPEDSRYLHIVCEEIEGWGLRENDYSTKYPNRTWVGNHKNIKLYSYDDNREYCPIGEINDKCSQLIQDIFNTLNPDLHTHLQPGEAEDRFLRILENLDGEITKAHESMRENVSQRTYPAINFKDIKDIITEEDEISTNRDYEKNCRKLKNKFICSCEKAVQDYILDDVNIDQAKIEGFKSIYNKIVRKSNKNFMDLIYNFSFRMRENSSNIDFDETAIEEIIAKYIMEASLKDINTDKFLFDQLPQEKHVLSGIVGKQSISTSLKCNIQNFLRKSESIRPWSRDEFIVNQNITDDWKWNEELISSTQDHSKYSQGLINPEHLHRFTEADSIRLRSVKEAIRIKNQENE